MEAWLGVGLGERVLSVEVEVWLGEEVVGKGSPQTYTSLYCNGRYMVTGFINKNKDPIYQDFMRLLYNRYTHSTNHMTVT